ncbi:hypothetical protein PFICI_11585 [Pestalotiopsis fici W106-1]|uniref:Uncharacterized protein n=1 Tax=Pestalotiopsis fici (strain W106-1 / CGMCC3.15140) TaxID=1229662 RepID=W3WQS7_PESFW|nr:uncharacterized protein PFICI_11585 [Pestalotiopsis fici W106-1]ETS76198.1 hypothetical protein PFICI_11585 [Pestalotiopsis fici W106-1]
MAKHLFVQKIATLEGYKGVDIAQAFFDVTLQNVDARLINLEKLFSIASPPPMLDVTWESLEFRAKRLWQYLPRQALVVTVDRDDQAQGSSVTPEALRKVLIRLDPSPLLSREPEKKKKKRTATDKLDEYTKHDEAATAAIDEEDFDLAYEAQKLCHAAGKRGLAIVDPIKDLDYLYAAAVDLTISFETNRRHPNIRPPGMPPGMMGPGMPPPMRPPVHPFGKPPKPCCGCCSCYCHSPSPRIIDVDVKKKKRITGGFFRFGWLRNLFRRKKTTDYDSDTASYTSSSASSTIV